MSAMEIPGLATRARIRLRPDPTRVISRLFVAGIELEGSGESRASNVVTRVLDLDEAAVETYVDELFESFGGRHADLISTFLHHADRIGNRLPPGAVLSLERRYLLGAMFTHEFSVEAAALCNPSIVPHPDQTGVAVGAQRFVMSVRGIGEGHRSSIGFRTGTVHANGSVTIDAAESAATVATVQPSLLEGATFRRMLREAGHDDESSAFVIDHLGPSFTIDALEDRLLKLRGQGDTRRNVAAAIARIRNVAASTYTAVFDASVPMSARILWPHCDAESHGMEDARFVRMEDPERTVYCGTYTAYDGSNVRQHLIETDDFTSFAVTPMSGRAADNKGLAIFPRRIGGRYYALSRADRETNAVAVSDDLGSWQESEVLQTPVRPWEAIQLGNCGAPIETSEGWLVLTHAVGAMRTYTIGAMLVDLDDPTKVIASLDQPLLSPNADERDGYVPNVVYSCGAMLHEGLLVLPYGVSDQSIALATVPMDELLASMH